MATVSLLLLLLMPVFYTQAQNRDLLRFESFVKMADTQFKLEYYSNASGFYQQALKINSESPHASFYLAECYRNLFDYTSAATHYQKASELDLQKFPLSLFYFALMQKLNRDYENSINVFNDFIEKTKQISADNFPQKKAFYERALIELDGCYWSLEQLTKPHCNNLKAPVNSPANDFSPTIFKNENSIIISSGRSKSDAKETFTDNYYFVESDTSWVNTELPNNLNVINTRFNDGSGVFTKDGKRYYYTSCGQEDSYCKIYVTLLKSGRWQKPKLLNENINAAFSNSKQPSITANGDTLFFVSDRQGGYGMNDIWMSILNSGEWTEPVNLGNQINTAFNEVSPFFYPPENLLFFSSDGHRGFGELDIFYCENFLEQNAELKNIADPYNSNLNDIYFILTKTKGYLISNRTGGLGKFDVYQCSNMFVESEFVDYHTKLQKLNEEL